MTNPVISHPVERDRNLQFISGNFLDTPIPKEKAYLKKYFSTEIQAAFLRYYLEFGDISCFVAHTGIWTTSSNLHRLEQRYLSIIQAHREAKSEMDIELIHKIESGKYRE